MTVPDPSPARTLPAGDGRLAEVWGDVVDLRHLAAAVAVGAIVSLGCYAVATRVFAALVGPTDVARSYAMLVGLLGCVAGGAISGRLFPPKRVMTEFARTPASPSASERPGAVTDLPVEVAEEMRALGLRDVAVHDDV